MDGAKRIGADNYPLIEYRFVVFKNKWLIDTETIETAGGEHDCKFQAFAYDLDTPISILWELVEYMNVDCYNVSFNDKKLKDVKIEKRMNMIVIPADSLN